MSLSGIEVTMDGLLDHALRRAANHHAFEVARSLPSQNKLKGNTRESSYAYSSERAWWHKQLSMAKMAKWVTPASGFRVVRITRVLGKGSKFFDMGNLVGGCKAMLDAMVNTGVLVDYSPTHCSIFYRQVRGEFDAVRFEVWE